MQGKLIVVSGPSGAGKSTITKLVRDKLNIPLSVSVTTREPREGEIDGKDYIFMTNEEFMKKIENNEFYEYAEVHGNYYGTLRKTVETELEKGNNIILEIDIQGGLIVKEKNKNAVLVFLKTETPSELLLRLKERNTDSEEVIKKRIENAENELKYENKYDFTIINRGIEKSCNELINIIEK